MTQANHYLSNFPKSYWLENLEETAFPQLKEDIHVDVTIVGAGITGITAAYLLADKGLKIALIDSTRIMNGTTGHTTAKVTAQHGLIYDELISTVGKEQAKLYYEANMEGLSFIKRTVKELDIDCTFQEENAFIYATTEGNERKIEDEAKAYETLEIPGQLLETIPQLNIETTNALQMTAQAQFHPVKYLSKLIEAIKAKDVQIYENTTAVKIDTGKQNAVVTRGGAKAMSKYVLISSHFPFYEGKGLYAGRLHADRSYVLAAKTKKTFPGGMYISAEVPTFSLRSIRIDNEEMVLFSGQGHKTGKGKDEKKHFQALELFGDETLGISSISYHWAAQDLITLDKIPYIGPLTPGKPDVFVATGYRKWGMTTSYTAAKLFHDHVLEKENKYEELFTPSRFHPKPSLKSAAKVNVDTVSELVKGKLEKPETDSETLDKDEGAVVTIDGHRKGAYRDKEGELHIVDTTCTHAGCEVNWNNAERTWDCPCHGSRFSHTGEVLEGPAEKPLKKYDFKMIDNYTTDESGY